MSIELWKLQAVFAIDVGKLLARIHDQGYLCTLGEAWRTPEQARWNALHGAGIVKSLHCDRLAIDLNLYNDAGIYLKEFKDYEPFGIYWESLDPKNRWGGRFPRVDSDHFERSY